MCGGGGGGGGGGGQRTEREGGYTTRSHEQLGKVCGGLDHMIN